MPGSNSGYTGTAELPKKAGPAGGVFCTRGTLDFGRMFLGSDGFKEPVVVINDIPDRDKPGYVRPVVVL